jgi:choline-sulfatase
MTQPNIILCTCDQLRAFEVGCYGNPVIRTPNLDQLAAEGVRFETAVTTFPVCMAARSVLLSGQYNRTCTGGVGNVASSQGEGRIYFPQYPHAGRPHLKDETLPELLHRRGYHTATIGKWHIHTWPHDLGFDDTLIPRMNHAHTGQHFSENGGPEFVPDGYSVDFECDRVAAFLGRQAQSERPFFLYYNISPPHCPMSDAPEKYTTMYRPAEIPIRPNVDLSTRLPDQDHWFKVYRWDYRYYNFHLPYTEELPEDFTLQRVIAEYYGMTTWVDDAVGRMLAALEANGLAENTIVVFTSDHGDYLGSHGRVQKGDLHEESVRIPLLVRWPAGLESGATSPQVAALVDLAPTLLDLAGAEIPAHMAGRSLAGFHWDTANGPRPQSDVLSSSKGLSKGRRFDQLSARETEDCAFIETGRGVGIRTRTHLYGLPFVAGTHDLADAPHYFWDVEHDPYQLRNLAGTGEQADVASELDRRLRAWDAATPWMPA